MKFICREEFHDDMIKKDTVKTGDVVYVHPFIQAMVSSENNKLGAFLDAYHLNRHFMQYDMLEYEHVYTAVAMILMEDMNGYEELTLDRLEDYINKRRKVLCETDHTRRERTSTETPRTTK